MNCIVCGDGFEPGHRGYVNECYDCSFKRKAHRGAAETSGRGRELFRQQ